MDFDGSGTVDGEDLLALVHNFGRFVPPELGDLDGDFLVNDSDLNLLLSALGSNNAVADFDQNGVVDQTDLDVLLYYFGSDFTPGPIQVPIGPVQQKTNVNEEPVMGPIAFPPAEIAGSVVTGKASRNDTPAFTRRRDQNPFHQRARLHDQAFLAATQAGQRSFWWHANHRQRKEKARWSDEVDRLFQNEKPDAFFPEL